GKEAEIYAFLRFGSTEKTIQDFMRGAVAADGDELAVTLRVSFGGEVNRVAAIGCSGYIDLQAAFTQLREVFASGVRGFAARRPGVDDGEESILLQGHGYKGSIAEERSSCARRSARMFRFILREAVRGKSSSSSTTPWTRL